MSNQVLLVFWAVLLGVVLFAWWRGAAPERIAASALLGSALLAEAVYMWIPKGARSGVLLAIDGVLALTFLLSAMRYVRPWLGIAVVLEGVQFSLHAYFFVADEPHNFFYAVVNNLITIGILLCLLVGAWLNHRARLATAVK